MEYVSPRRFLDAIQRVIDNADQTLDAEQFDEMLDELVRRVRSTQVQLLEGATSA